MTTYIRTKDYKKLDEAILLGLGSELFSLRYETLSYEGDSGEMVNVPYSEYGFDFSELVRYLYDLDREGRLEVIDPENRNIFIIPRYS